MKKSFKKIISSAIISNLSSAEIAQATYCAKILAKHVGPSKAITAGELVVLLEIKYKRAIHMSSVRKYINYIRISGMLKNLIAGSRGYYIADTPQQVLDYIKSLRHRAYTIMCVMDSYEV